MKKAQWITLALFFAGFAWTPAWLACLVWFELVVRGGRDVAAFWAESHIRNRNGSNH